MLDNNQEISLVQLLQNAGLVSQQQIAKAIKAQVEYPQMSLGEILVLQNILKSTTVSFFSDRWQEITEEGQQFTIGHYLKEAGLLEDKQIQLVLAEQKNSQQSFGAIAVAKGWLSQTTVDFFANNLTPKTPEYISLESLAKYDLQTGNLTRKYSGSNLILTRILAWTRGNLTLTKTIYHAFVKGDFNLNPGQEIAAVDGLIEIKLIQNWQQDALGEHIRYIRSKLGINKNCPPLSLLQQYREILLSGSQPNQRTIAQQELLTLGLIVEQDNRLRVGNLLYQQIFNQDWLAAKISKLKLAAQKSHNNFETSQPKSNQPENQLQQRSGAIEQSPKSASKDKLDKQYVQNMLPDIDALDLHNNTPPKLIEPKASLAKITPPVAAKAVRQISSVNGTQFKNTQKKIAAPEPITKVVSLVTLLGLILLVPLVWLVNNYYSANLSNTISREDATDPQKLKQFCQELDFVDAEISLKSISELENSQQELIDNFPDGSQTLPKNCEVALDKLRVLAAPQLGREHRVIEAVKNLCNVPADSQSLNEAKIWLDRWYYSPDWGKATKKYLELTPNCPANDPTRVLDLG